MHYNISEGIFSILKYIHTYIVVTCLSAGLAVTRGQYLFWAFSQCVQMFNTNHRTAEKKMSVRLFSLHKLNFFSLLIVVFNRGDKIDTLH